MRTQWLRAEVLMGTIVLLTGCAQGEYRMPYANGTVVEVVRFCSTRSATDRLAATVSLKSNDSACGAVAYANRLASTVGATVSTSTTNVAR